MSSSMKKMRSQPSIRASSSPVFRFRLRSLLRVPQTALPGVMDPACGLEVTQEPFAAFLRHLDNGGVRQFVLREQGADLVRVRAETAQDDEPGAGFRG